MSQATKKILFVAVAAVIIAGGVYIGLTKNKKPQTDLTKIQVMTTLFPLYDFVKNIGGDKTEVSLLLPPGVEAHNFEPKPSDLVKINQADIFIYTGKFMETWAEDIINGISGKNVQVVDASLGITVLAEQRVDLTGKNNGIDPHIWLDFDNAKIMVDNIAAALTAVDSVNADWYQNNAAEYKNKLTELDQEYKTNLAQCASQEIIYGGHYAFGYLAAKYGWSYQSAYGLSPDAEPSAKDFAKIIEQIKNDKIKYIFFEELVSPKAAETLATETGVGLLLLNPAHNLTKKDFMNNISFIEVMNNNLDNLAIGLRCQ